MGVSTPTETISHSLPSSPLHFDFSIDQMDQMDSMDSIYSVDLVDPVDSVMTGNSPRDEEGEREKFPPSSIIKKSQIFGIRKELGFESLPPFRKRVVFLPPIQIVTQRRLLEQRGREKEVRFFTNVICHEYQSY